MVVKIGKYIETEKDLKSSSYERELALIFLFVLLLYVPSQQLWQWRDG